MYDPLIEITFKDFSPSFVRCSTINRVDPKEKRVYLKDGQRFNYVDNGLQIIDKVNEIENRNELSLLIHT